LETVKVVWAATQVESWMVVGTTSRVGGMGVAVGEALAVSEVAGVLVVLGGFPPGPPGRVAVGAPEAEEALLFAAALLFEEADVSLGLQLRREWLVEGSGMCRRRLAVCTEQRAAPRAVRDGRGLRGLNPASAACATHLHHALASS